MHPFHTAFWKCRIGEFLYFLVFLIAASCNQRAASQDPVERVMQVYDHDYDGLIEQSLDCTPRTGEPQPGDGSHTRMGQVSQDGRWVSYRDFGDFASQFYLYDLKEEIRYTITHANRVLQLYDFSFSRNGSHLSFRSTPRAGGSGVSEIIVIKLDDMSYFAYGKAGYLYRNPIYAEEDGGLLFFASHAPLVERSLLAVIHRDSILKTPGRYHPDSGETYMPALESPDQLERQFKPFPKVWTVDKTYKEFAQPMGTSIFPGEEPGSYVFTDGNTDWLTYEEFRKLKPGENKFLYMTGVVVRLIDGVAMAGPPFLMTREEALMPLSSNALVPNIIFEGKFANRYLCLENVQIK